MNMTDKPLISIITPMYNAENFVAETIDSVLAQAFTNWEMIIVDNCSTDGSRDVVRSYIEKDPRISLIESPFNSGGPAKPRNTGVSLARGDYLAFLDADDLWTRDKLEKQIEYLKNNEGIDLVYTGVETFGAVSRQFTTDKDFKNIYDLFKKNTVYTSSTAVRNTSDIHFSEDPALVGVEDYALWARLYHNNYGFIQIKEALTRIRVLPQSTSRSNESRQVLRAMKVFIDFCIENNKIEFWPFVRVMVLGHGAALVRKKVKALLKADK